MSQLCLWSQGREAGRGRQAGCSGPEPGHTLCHAGQRKPRSERDRGLRGNLKSGLPGPKRAILPPPVQLLDTSGPLSLARTRSPLRRLCGDKPCLRWNLSRNGLKQLVQTLTARHSITVQRFEFWVVNVQQSVATFATMLCRSPTVAQNTSCISAMLT